MIRKIANRVCFLFFLVGCASVNIHTQSRSTISGYVFGPHRSPIENARVELRNDVNSTLARTQSDTSGRFLFFNVPSGRLSVTVLPLGTDLAEQTQEIEIGGVGVRGQSVAENVQLDFYLRPGKPRERMVNAVVFQQDVPEEASRIFATAIADLDGKRPEAGIDGIKKALVVFPKYFLALQRLGAEYLRQEKFSDASAAFTGAAAVNPDSLESWYGLSLSSYSDGKFEAAVVAATRALVVDKNSVNSLLVLGMSQRGLTHFDEAEKALLRAKRLDNGKTPEIYWNLALLYAYNLKRNDAAADELELFLKATPDNPESANIRKLIKKLRANQPLSK
jgi:tetratricopeptide (TPR) repeat protein